MSGWQLPTLVALLPLVVAGVGVVCLKLGAWLCYRLPDTWRQRWRVLDALPFFARDRQLQERITTLLRPLPQTFEYLAPQKWVVHALQVLRPQLDTLVDEAVEKHHGVLWENLPVLLKNRMYERVHRQMPAVLDDIIEEIGDQSDLLLDVSHMMEMADGHHPDLFKRLANDAATPWLGAGVVTMFLGTWLASTCSTLAYAWLGNVWLLLAGWPASLGLGLWMRQQHLHTHQHRWACRHRERRERHIVDSVSEQLANELLTPRHWVLSVMDGPNDRHTHLVIKRHVGRLVDLLTIRTFLQVTVGASGFVGLKLALNDTIRAALRMPFDDARFNRGQSSDVQALLTQRFTRWSPQQQLAIVRPALDAQLTTAVVTGIGASAGLAFMTHHWWWPWLVSTL